MIVDELIALTSAEHDATNDHKFMRRYKTPNLMVADHYRHLKQLYVIYRALESKMSAFVDVARLPQELRFLMHRSELIRKDLLFLKPFVSELDNAISPAAQAYADAIKASKNGIEVWGHFLCRILADLYGGNKTKRYVHDLYARSHLSVKDGADFYAFEAGTLHKLKVWLENQNSKFSAQVLKPYFVNSFARHDAIFSELEATRIGVDVECPVEDETVTESQSECPLGFDRQTKKPVPPPHCCGFFSKKVAAVAAVVAVAAVGAMSLT